MPQVLTNWFERLAALVQPWADLYSEQTALATTVLVIHVLGMFVAGGMAIAADRAILRVPAGTADAMRAQLAELSSIHGVVISALVLTMASGAALFASDVPTFSVSRVYWAKMLCVGMLLLNGLRMRRAEGAVLASLDGASVHTAEAPGPGPQAAAWGSVRSTARLSLALWVSLVVLGVVLTNG